MSASPPAVLFNASAHPGALEIEVLTDVWPKEKKKKRREREGEGLEFNLIMLFLHVPLSLNT